MENNRIGIDGCHNPTHEPDGRTPIPEGREHAARHQQLALILANLVPLAGVLFWDWDIFNIVVLYWFENVIIGGINILKMPTCAPDMEASQTGRGTSRCSRGKSGNG
jgi:hypothetical protein